MGGYSINVQKADFHSMILFTLSEKEDILIVVNDNTCWIMSILHNEMPSFLDPLNEFNQSKSGLEVVEC